MEKRKLAAAGLVWPGRILRRELDERGWTQREFSDMIDLSEKAISAIVNGKKQIMPETALKFAAALGGSPKFWLNLEADYRLHLAQRKVDEASLEAIRGRSVARMEKKPASATPVAADHGAEEKQDTVELPVDSSLEADLVEEAQREGVSLEEFVSAALREKIYG